MRSVSIHDIALLKLDKPLTLDHTVNVVCIPVQNRRNLEGQIMTISGWGRTITEMSKSLVSSTVISVSIA